MGGPKVAGALALLRGFTQQRDRLIAACRRERTHVQRVPEPVKPTIIVLVGRGHLPEERFHSGDIRFGRVVVPAVRVQRVRIVRLGGECPLVMSGGLVEVSNSQLDVAQILLDNVIDRLVTGAGELQQCVALR